MLDLVAAIAPGGDCLADVAVVRVQPELAVRPGRLGPDDQPLDADGKPRAGAQVAELTRWLPKTVAGWPEGMRGIARRERPHPGTQLRITDHEGWRITIFAFNPQGGRLADLEVRHRLRARAEDRIRGPGTRG